MTITISPDVNAAPPCFQARAGNVEATGSTVGAALDALDAAFPETGNGEGNEPAVTLVIVQRFRPDTFFTAVQQTRLSHLMERFRAARDEGQSLPEATHKELEALVQAELQGTKKRAQALLDAAP